MLNENQVGMYPVDVDGVRNLNEQIAQLTKELDDEKKWSEELAKACCEMEDALGFKQDQTDEHGAMVPTFGPWKERVRDLLAKEGELGDLKDEVESLRTRPDSKTAEFDEMCNQCLDLQAKLSQL